jgi:putative transposase
MSLKSYTPKQIIGILREAEVGLVWGNTVGTSHRRLGINEQSYYGWYREYGGIKVEHANRLKDLERENARLRISVWDLTLDKLILREAIERNY